MSFKDRKGERSGNECQIKNKRAISMICAGLKDAKKGKLVKAREGYSKYIKRSN